MNAHIIYDEIVVKSLDYLKDSYEERRRNRRFIFSPNTYFSYTDPPAKLLSYEETAICILVPISPEKGFGSGILMKPFDTPTWIALFFSMFICGVFWGYFSKNLSYTWQFMFGFFGYLLGQGVYVRNQKMSLKIVMQVVIFMTIVLSQSYQGAVTSFLLKGSSTRLTTFDEVLKSEHTLLIGSLHDFILKEFDNYKEAKHRSKVNVSGHLISAN